MKPHEHHEWASRLADQVESMCIEGLGECKEAEILIRLAEVHVRLAVAPIWSEDGQPMWIGKPFFPKTGAES